MGDLWVLAHLRAGAFTLFKVWCERNSTDLCTKHEARLLALTRVVREPGRAATAPLVTAEVKHRPCRGPGGVGPPLRAPRQAVGILEDSLPSYMESVVEEHFWVQGFGLRELAVSAASLQHLIHVTASRRMSCP